MKRALALLVLLGSDIVLAQTQWVTATVDGATVSWIWSITPTPATATAAASPSTTPPATVTTTQTLIPLPAVTGVSSNLPSPSSTPSLLSTSSSRSSSSSPISSTSSIAIASFRPDVTSSDLGLILSQPTALPSSSGPAATPANTSPVAKSSSNNTLIKIILGVVFSILGVLLLAIALFLCLRRRRRRRDAAEDARTSLGREKHFTENTEYLSQTQPTFPMLKSAHPSTSQLYMPAPTAAVSGRPRHYSSDAQTLIEPDMATRNPFMASSELLAATRTPGSSRGSYQPVDSRFPPSTAQQPYYDPATSELPGTRANTEFRPPPVPTFAGNQHSSSSHNPYSDDSLNSSNYHGDLGIVGQYNGIPQHDMSSHPAFREQRGHQPSGPPVAPRRPYAVRPPSVITDPARSYPARHPGQPTYSPNGPQGFDFGFNRPNSAGPASRNPKGPTTSVREQEPEQTPMITPDEDEEEEGEPGLGGMVPLGSQPRHPSGARRDSLGLGDRLGSLRRSASIRSGRHGSLKRFAVPRRPVGGGS